MSGPRCNAVGYSTPFNGVTPYVCEHSGCKRNATHLFDEGARTYRRWCDKHLPNENEHGTKEETMSKLGAAKPHTPQVALSAGGRLFNETRVSKFVFETRKLKNQSQHVAGEALGFNRPQNHMSAIETSRVVPSDDQLKAIAKWSGVALKKLQKMIEADRKEREQWRLQSAKQSGSKAAKTRKKTRKKARKAAEAQGLKPHVTASDEDFWKDRDDTLVVQSYLGMTGRDIADLLGIANTNAAWDRLDYLRDKRKTVVTARMKRRMSESEAAYRRRCEKAEAEVNKRSERGNVIWPEGETPKPPSVAPPPPPRAPIPAPVIPPPAPAPVPDNGASATPGTFTIALSAGGVTLANRTLSAAQFEAVLKAIGGV